mgnify:CR=1 FL=1
MGRLNVGKTGLGVCKVPCETGLVVERRGRLSLFTEGGVILAPGNCAPDRYRENRLE